MPEKRRLLVWSPLSQKLYTHLAKLQCPIVVEGQTIDYVDSAEHVGIRRSSTGGNMPHIIDRIAAHSRAMGALLQAGAARHHGANPSSSLHLEKLYGSRVLFSGSASLVLNKKEMNTLSQHHRRTICRLQKLPENTPDCVIFFLAGRLPAPAILDLRMLSLLGMIARLGPTALIQKVGRHMIISRNNKSWFNKVQSLCSDYHLPNPLQLFQNPPSKESWKNMCKSKVISFWEDKLRLEAEHLSSLHFFKPQFLSLARPHPMWTAPDNSHEVKKAVTVASMLSGRYVTDHRARHWSRTNPEGFCHLCMAASKAQDDHPREDSILPVGSLTHLLLECPELHQPRDVVRSLWNDYTLDKPIIREIIFSYQNEPSIPSNWNPEIQLLLDPTACPSVISASQTHGAGILHHILYLTRTWCHSLHSRRQKLLKLLNVI